MGENKHHVLPIASYAFLLLTLLACSSLPLPSSPTKINARILASFDINPDASGRPSPVVVRVYELKSKDIFDKADFFKLYDQEAATLGGDLLSRDEFELSPGEGREVKRKTQEQARYIGVIAAFRNIGQAHWRVSAELKPNKNNTFTIEIGKQTVTVHQQQ